MTALHESTIATDELRPTRVEVDLDVLAENYRAIAAHVAPARVMPILKANAYGHGLVEIGRVVERLGVHWYSAEMLLEESLRCRHVRVEGIFTHFANADARDLAHARLQLERFHETLGFYERRSLPPPLRHAANSGAIVQLRESHLDLVRPGVLFYGVRPTLEVAAAIPVRQALSWVTRVVYFKVVRAGQPVSYGGEWVAPAQTRVVTLPVGYGDGYARAMSGRAEVIVRGKRYPVVGRICMDQIMVSIGWDSAYNGDEVVLLGRQGAAGISIEEMAGWASTIPHEILTSINTRVPRVYRGGT